MRIVSSGKAMLDLVNTRYLGMLAAASVAMAPSLARAAVTGGGGGMPYSAGLTTFNTSMRTEVAGILIVIAVTCGVGAYIFAGQMEALANSIGRILIGIAIIGGVAAVATLAGVTGAVV